MSTRLLLGDCRVTLPTLPAGAAPARTERGRFLPGTHWRPHQSFREREWLEREYVVNQRSMANIASQFGVREDAIRYWLKKHGIRRRSISEARRVKKWGSFGASNPMYGVRGVANGNWRHGRTPERQAFYASAEWSAAVRAVWQRDVGRCQRCGVRPERRGQFHVHHLTSFGVRELRTELSNLALLCGACHRWVHSRANADGAFIDRKEVMS